MKKMNLLKIISATLVAGQISYAQEKKPIDCATLTSRTEIFNGKSYTKYNVVDSAYMKCPQIQETIPVMNWKVTSASWSAQDERNFGIFVKKIGESKCNTTDKCLSGPANILRTEEDMLFTHYSDCADFPYYLRSYFAYKNNLPFAMVTSIKQAPYSDEQTAQIAAEREKILISKGEDAALKYDVATADLRYSRNGNIPVGKLNVPSPSGAVRDFAVLGPKIMDQISSGTLRMLNGVNGSVESDFYSPAVTKESIKPGTVLYNVAGHVAVVYDVTASGDVLFVDAHPDNSVTRGVFGTDYKVLKPSYGGNFKNFRPLNVLNPSFNSEGHLVKGQVVALSDGQIADVSLEQYVSAGLDQFNDTMFKLSEFPNAPLVEFNDWIRFRLSKGAFRLNPIEAVQSEVNQLCVMAQDRVAAVQAATDNLIHTKNHPEELPRNIFGAEGEWEAYSSPGRDLRLKARTLDIPKKAKKWMIRQKNGYQLQSYQGQDVKLDMISAYKKASAMCKITYKNSAGAETTIGLEELLTRLSKISYDPYACPEIRWGASRAADLATCVDSQEKMEWHNLQQFLRNNLVKDSQAVHGFTLEQLRQMNERKEVDNTSSPERFRITSKLEAM